VSRRHKKKLPLDAVETEIESLSHDGRGVAHINGKAVFVEGALPGERVSFRYTRCRSQFDEGRVEQVLRASAQRVEAACEFYQVCGGCRLQHLDAAEQVRLKQTVLLDNLTRIGKVKPESILEPLCGPIWGYRQKARLGVRYVRKKERVLVGFREKNSAFLAEMDSCKILNPRIGEHLQDLSSAIAQLSCYDKIAQIEVAIGDENAALVIRHLVELSAADRDILTEFGKQFDFQIYLQPAGPDSIELLWPDTAGLAYALPDYQLQIDFKPMDFTQVNSQLNRSMVQQAIALLQPQADETVLELFCGLGNFSLPLARHAKQVVAVEGEASLIERARENAANNGIHNVEYHVANLMDAVAGMAWLRERKYQKILLDPPRSGAIEIIPQLATLGARRIVYVSCNPATLARDAGMLVNEYGYRLQQAGVMDMFPHTAHMESIALFVKD